MEEKKELIFNKWYDLSIFKIENIVKDVSNLLIDCPSNIYGNNPGPFYFAKANIHLLSIENIYIGEFEYAVKQAVDKLMIYEPKPNNGRSLFIFDKSSQKYIIHIGYYNEPARNGKGVGVSWRHRDEEIQELILNVINGKL